MAKPAAIRFYGVSGKFGAFSNFARYPVRLKEQEWPTSEHYFQAQKFAGTVHEQRVRMATSPMLAAKIGRDRRLPLRPDWDSVKDDVMREVILAKFQQHPTLLALLLSTGTSELIEHTKTDAYWGDGGDGSGLNKLGTILMEARERLRGSHSNGPFGLTSRQIEVAFRPIDYVVHDFHADPVAVTSSLLAFFHDVSSLSACGIFPPIHLLNHVLGSGGSPGGMSGGATWKPFQLSAEEYDAVTAAISRVPFELVGVQSQSNRAQLKLDPSFDHLNDYISWIYAVCGKHRKHGGDT